MKILVTSIIDLKKSQHNRPHQFIKYLSQNHDVTVLSINDWWKGKQANLESYSEEFSYFYDRITYVYLTQKKISPIIQEVFSLKQVSDLLTNDFDVHLNYNTLISGNFASHNLNTVYDLADDLSAMIRESPQIPQFMRPIGGVLGNYLISKNLKKSEFITVTIPNLIKSYNVPSNKCEIVPNGVDTNFFQNYESAKEELGLNGFIIGYVGVLREWVDFKPVFLALKKLGPKVKMLIVGKEGQFNENLELAKECGVFDQVIFTGMVPYSLVPKYISAMDVCIIPFKKNAISENALPLKLFEYMSCEKPVISSDIFGVKSVVRDKVLYSSDPTSYKENISKLYEDPNLRLNMGKEGRKFVEESYDWKNIGRKMENILIKVKDM